MVTAKAIATGQGYRIPSLPGVPFAVKYPPIFPAFLSIAWRIRPDFPGSARVGAVMQALLVFDPRYRDFPLPVFAVPFVAVLARALLSDLPRAGGGWEEALAGGALAAGAIIGAIMEGPLNLPSLAWSAMALVLAGPPLLRLLPRRRAVAAPA